MIEKKVTKAQAKPRTEFTSSANPTAEGGPPKALTKEEKKALRESLKFESKDDKLLIKEPGSINGNPFDIRFLEKCYVYIHDQTA